MATNKKVTLQDTSAANLYPTTTADQILSDSDGSQLLEFDSTSKVLSLKDSTLNATLSSTATGAVDMANLTQDVQDAIAKGGAITGGTTGQFLTKKSNTDYDVQWSSVKTINNNSILGSGNIEINSGVWGNITGTLSNQTDLQTALNAKQATLVSGTNIKTVNNNSLLGEGNLEITGGTWGSITGTITDQTDLTTYVDGKVTNFVEVSAAPTVGKVWFDNSVEEGANIYTASEVDTLLANKQDTITFNTTYDPSTNKAATMADINSALGDIETLLAAI